MQIKKIIFCPDKQKLIRTLVLMLRTKLSSGINKKPLLQDKYDNISYILVEETEFHNKSSSGSKIKILIISESNNFATLPCTFEKIIIRSKTSDNL